MIVSREVIFSNRAFYSGGYFNFGSLLSLVNSLLDLKMLLFRFIRLFELLSLSFSLIS